MARKKNFKKPRTVQQSDITKQEIEMTETHPWKMTSSSWILPAILIITLISYLPALRGGFVWDDINYIQNSPEIRKFDLGGIFSGYVMGNYHPLTMLVFAIEYQLFGLHEAGYHFINLLLHMVNTGLVFYCILLLSKRTNIAWIAALLFGVHPLHVESVAWASELKDLLYTAFYLGSFIFYLKYLEEKQRKFLAYALLLFLLSLFSKAMAVSLPALFLLTDYFKGRKLNTAVWVEKIPFILLSIIFGIIAIKAQQSSSAIQDISVYSIPQRIVFACFGFSTYLWKLLIPIHQSAYYPYPIKSGESLSPIYYIYPLLLIAIAVYVFYSLRYSKKIFFGFGFFAVTVFLVLQLLPVGDAVMADRYSYIPSIGIFYLAAEGINWLWTKRSRNFALGLTGVFTLFFAISTWARTTVWKDGISLWNDVIKKYPNSSTAYNNRGGTYLNDKKPEEALKDLNKAIELQPNYPEALSNRGIILADKKQYDSALLDINKAIEIKPAYFQAINNRGVIFLDLGKTSEALADFNKAIELNPSYAEAYYNRGLLYTNQNNKDLALKDFDMALSIFPGYAEATLSKKRLMGGGTPEEAIAALDKAILEKTDDPQNYYDRAQVLQSVGRNAEALKDIEKAISLKPEFPEAHNKRGNLLVIDKKLDEAMIEYNLAIQQKQDFAEAYVNRANIYRDQNQPELAMKDYDKAIALDPTMAYAFYNRGILLISQKKFENVISEYTKVLELRGDSAMSYYNRGMAEFFLNRKDSACQDLKQAAGFGNQAASDAVTKFCK